MGAHGWVAGIASHGSITLSRGRLVTKESPGYPRHPSSIQHDTAVNLNYLVKHYSVALINIIVYLILFI